MLRCQGFGSLLEVSSPALRERFAHVRTPYFRFASRRDERQVALCVDERIPLAQDERVPLIECLLLSVQRLVESVLGGPMTEAAFRFAWPPPAYADAYRETFHGAVRFHARQCELAFPAHWMQLECPFADPVAHRDSLRVLEMLESWVKRGGGLVLQAGLDNRIPEEYTYLPLNALLPVVPTGAPDQTRYEMINPEAEKRFFLTPAGEVHPILRVLRDPAQVREFWRDDLYATEYYWYAPVERAKSRIATYPV